MRFSKLTLLFLGAAATCAGAGGTIALERLGLLAALPEPALTIAKPSAEEPIPSPEGPEGADRFTYVSLDLGALHWPGPTVEVVAVAPLKTLADEIPQSWSTETRAERVIPLLELPRLAVRPPQASAWKMPKASAPLRDYRLARRLAEISPGATRRLEEKFKSSKTAWPPAEVAFVTIKDEKAVELHARSEGGGAWKLVHRYPVLAASGKSGPKLEQGDRQVPEGVYSISYLNPASRYHVSLRVNYPNAFDRQMAAKDKRKNLGGDIMIHGKAVSAGCIAVGDEAAEELFVLAANVGLENVKVVIAPSDFRRNGLPPTNPAQPEWVPGLYAQVASAMTPFKPKPNPNLLSSFFGN